MCVYAVFWGGLHLEELPNSNKNSSNDIIDSPSPSSEKNSSFYKHCSHSRWTLEPFRATIWAKMMTNAAFFLPLTLQSHPTKFKNNIFLPWNASEPYHGAFQAMASFLHLLNLSLVPSCLQFAGLEGVITAMLDEYPHVLVKRREKFVFGLVCVCYLGALSTLTYVSCITSHLNVLWFINSFKTEHPPPLSHSREELLWWSCLRSTPQALQSSPWSCWRLLLFLGSMVSD